MVSGHPRFDSEVVFPVSSNSTAEGSKAKGNEALEQFINRLFPDMRSPSQYDMT